MDTILLFSETQAAAIRRLVLAAVMAWQQCQVQYNMMMINLYIAQIPYVQMRFTISMHEIDLKALKAPLAATIQFMSNL